MKILLLLILTVSLHCNEFDGFIEYENQNGDLIKKDLIEFINNGKKQIDTTISKIQKKAIMVLGLSGTGKTTLVNYLNGIPLVCKEINGAWRVRLESESNTLPGGFKIGHTEYSETQFPAVYTPPGMDFSFIDNPGFQDNRGTSYEISNSFFREHAIKQTDDIKFLLLITFQDLELRGQQFRSTIDRFYEMLGVFDNIENVKTLSKSVGIVVTRAENKGKSDTELKAYIGNKLRNILISAKKARKLPSPNIELVFNEVINKNQIEIFSGCDTNFQNKVIDATQKNQINNLINNLGYFNKVMSQFRSRMPPDEIDPVFTYVQDRYDVFKNEFDTKYHHDLIYDVENEIEKSKTIDDVNKFEGTLRTRKDSKNLFDFFLNENDKIYFKNKKDILDYFVQILRDKMQKHFNQNVNNELKLKIEQKLNNQIELLNRMKQTNSSTDSKGVLTFKGCFLKSSEIEDLYSSNVKSIILYLCQSIHFNKNITLRGLENLIIISPKWSVDDDKKIEVNMIGKDGKDHTIPAVNGHTFGASGSDGEPGSLGENGGRFFAFGHQLINLDNLVLKLDGGKGGRGQTGGDGVLSAHGGECTIPQFIYPNEIEECWKSGSFNFICSMQIKAVHTLVKEELSESRFGFISSKLWHYMNYGNMPTPGGNGGRGGKGGKGGLAGFGEIYKIDENLNKHYELKKFEGNIGQDGLDGPGGNGSPSGCRYRCTRSSSLPSEFTPISGFKSQYWLDNYQSYCEPGPHGLTPYDKNSAGLVSPKSKDQNLELIILDYTIEQYKNKFYNGRYHSFFESLNKVIREGKSDDDLIQTRIDEFKILDSIGYKPIYESLVYKTKKAKEILKTKSKQNQLVLDFLTAYGLSIINELDASANSLLIINLSDYIKLMLKNFETLENLKGDEFKYLYKKEYSELIESKINEANEFLKLSQQSIQAEYNKIEVYVKILEKDVENSIQDTKNNIESLKRTKRELEEARKKKLLFGILNFVVQSVGLMLSPILPFAPVVSGVVVAGLSFVQDPSIPNLINFGNSALKFTDQAKQTENGNLIGNIESIAKDLQPLLETAKLLSNKNGGDQISQIDNQITLLKSQIKNLENYQTKVVKSFSVYMHEVIGTIERYESTLKNKSNVALVYNNKDLKLYFKNVLYSIESVLGPFESSVKNFRSIVDNLKETLELSMVIYTKINEYSEHMAFADYLVNIQSPVSTDYGKYQNDVNSLASSLQFNVVHEMYVKTIKSIEQWMFPFEAKILSDLTRLTGSQNEKVLIMKQNLVKLERRVESYFSSGQKIDQAIMKMKFSESEPFYKWTCEDNQENIERLFRGETAIFRSDIKNSVRNAVKFNRIEIKIESKLQPGLIRVLEENFQVTLRHSGKSYFKYKDSYKVALNDEPFSITFSFKKDSNGLPLIRNGIYDKMMNGIFAISPYTSWIIQFQPIKNSNINLELVSKCDIEISLIGEGSYVDENLIHK